MVEKSGMRYADVVYDIDMTKLIADLFGFVSDKKMDVVLFGGTALNRGFFGAKQRLSKDLDIMVRSGGLSSLAGMISRHLGSLGYRMGRYEVESEEPSEEEDEPYSVKLIAATENKSNIEIAIYREDLSFDVTYVPLHSFAEYFNYPYIYPVKVPSYRLEGLLARKVYALYDRRLYKDLYDSRHGLELPLDKMRFLRNLSAITDYSKLKGVINGFDKDAIGGIDDYGPLVQKEYRESVGSMLKFVKMKLHSMRISPSRQA